MPQRSQVTTNFSFPILGHAATQPQEKHRQFRNAIIWHFTMPSTAELFLHKCQGHECGRWSAQPTPKEDEKALRKSVAADSIVHNRIRRNHEWTTALFTIQDPTMRAHLLSALADYQDLDLEIEKWNFKPPFERLVHRWESVSAIPESAGPSKVEAITHLIEFLRPVLAPSLDRVAETAQSGMVTFDRIWHIFPPGQLVLTTFYGLEAACRITKCKEGHIGDMKVWNVSMEYVDWNGNSCGYAPTTATIQGFQKTRRVTSLPVYPLSFHPEKSAVEARLLARGRHFESLRGYQFQSCVGTKIMLEGVSEERPVSLFHSWR
ncbi:hypothetical protein IMZ48_42740, partial [Candidatus Bathyarchaeota archaeon]|nr:hypothetical protein [Candidatus Bathyarchaeota archaeon]